MAKTMSMKVAVALLAIVIGGVAFQSAEAVVHVVGDALGWQNPPNSTYYAEWAAARNFTIGDSLVFNFATGAHNVATVTLDDYSDCDTDSSLNLRNSGPATINLTANGMQYYICTFSGHCSRGQKLAINVVGTGTTTPSTPSPPGTTPSTPSPPGTTVTPPPPPPPSTDSAASVASNVALMMLMSLVVVFM
ncbi:cucumber peeling cupredoxin [Ricinus communis]|uniref:Cucumber peeling cupredoxin, putative n=1 Tax=Ricinus communis TaxID=3988 RepID=B9SMH6_RICCO|nr:cucumber peeling cupredoxin [Ricinus communis]EEF35208.1 Cucumber peeling cupredoxin, putative [Ricinus communis]|eukprot:XP_002527195.1 cucumber peeling cupredoxin [Ricinus communis]